MTECENQRKMQSLDCVKLPDDFPVHFASEVYRVGALRRVAKMLALPGGGDLPRASSILLLSHAPIYFVVVILRIFLFTVMTFCLAAGLLRNRFIAAPRQDVNNTAISAGDQLSFHYELAIEELRPSFRVLDVACGNGYGTRKFLVPSPRHTVATLMGPQLKKRDS